MGGKSGGQKWGGALNNNKIKNKTNKCLISQVALPPAGRKIYFFSILGQKVIVFRFPAKNPKIYAFWSFCVILTLLLILNQNFVFAQKRKKVNFSTRRRQRHLTN